VKLIGYIRVSSEEQATSGLSLGSQEQRIRQYADLYQHELVALHQDAGISGKSIENRPGVLAALYDLAYVPADGLIVDNLNRLTRNVGDLGKLMKDFFTTKALITVQDHIDTSTAAGRLMANVIITVSQWQLEDGAEKTRNVLRTRKRVTKESGALNPAMGHRAKRGKLAVGQAPYGYAWHDKVLVENQNEQKWISFMRQQREHGKSHYAICLELKNRQVPARGGGDWHPTQVQRILKAEWNQ
jgi:DNA invertase Pin-like site-specific DNA recombinase